MRQLFFLFFLLTLGLYGSSRESVFSITPEQMVFASKLSDPYRKLYCYHFSMLERQEALEKWRSELDSISMVAQSSPDESVQAVFLLHAGSLKESASAARPMD